MLYLSLDEIVTKYSDILDKARDWAWFELLNVNPLFLSFKNVFLTKFVTEIVHTTLVPGTF